MILDQAEDQGGIEWIYLEGGEPFLHYSLLLESTRQAAERGFRVGLVTNAFWAVDPDLALQRLRPLQGRVEDFTVSIDDYHGDGPMRANGRRALDAAGALGIPTDVIRVDQPGRRDAAADSGELSGSQLMYRGRAAECLADRENQFPVRQFDSCPWEDLAEPGRVHLDPLGWVHVCQGITIGNFLERPLRDIFAEYEPRSHPVVGPLLAGGPAELARRLGTDTERGYADACHLCYATRCANRHLLPDELGPGQMYGEFGD